MPAVIFPYDKVMRWSPLILILFITFTNSHIQSPNGKVRDSSSSSNVLASSKASSGNITGSKHPPVISKFRSLGIYSREYNSTIRIHKCILLASRCLRWVHWNLMTCSTLVKQMDWYESCVLKAAATPEGKKLMTSWLAKTKPYHKGLFDCIATVEDNYAFGMEMPVKQLIDDAPAVALCIKFHSEEWEECVSSSVGIDCSAASMCWTKESIRKAKEATQLKLDAYHDYLTSSCPDQSF